MKFLTKINRNYLIPLVLVLIPVSVGGYFVLQEIIRSDTEETLYQRTLLITKQIEETGQLPNVYPIIETRKIAKKSVEKPTLKKIYMSNEYEDETEPFLEYATQVKINDAYYAIKIRQSLFEDEDLVYILASMLVILILVVFVISYVIVRRANKTIWADFEMNLLTIENFSFSDERDLDLKKSGIEEFERLNKVVTNMTEKLQKDYRSLKEFTENASHEIQTPLFIALLKLEEILQQDLPEETFKKVVDSMNALKRLSTLNQSLILLTKIENKQFVASEPISLNNIVKERIQDFSSLTENKKLNVELNSETDFQVKMHEELAQVLINNLLSNAINHNIENGTIQIDIKNDNFVICNSGEENSLTNDTIFNRFAKGHSKSYGLGLALVKKICDTHDLDIRYTKNGKHCFTISKKVEK